MYKQLSTSRFLSLMFVNIIIMATATFSMGLFHSHSNEFNMVRLELHSSERNGSNIFTRIKDSCIKIFIRCPDFDLPSAIDLCNYCYLSMIMTRMVMILSLFYNAYLQCALFYAYRLSVVMVTMVSILIFDIHFIIDEWIVHSIQLTLIMISFGIIIAHYALSNSDDDLQNKRLKSSN